MLTESCGITHPGEVRKVNEDQFLIGDLHKSMLATQTSMVEEEYKKLVGKQQGKLLVVADGMGGVKGGKQSSLLALETIADFILNKMSWFFNQEHEYQEEIKEELKKSLKLCQLNIEATGAANNMSMGTTLTMAYVLWPVLYVVHVGDSRCYLYRSGELSQITNDHTLAQKLVDKGTLSSKQAKKSPLNNILTSSVGGKDGHLNPEFHRINHLHKDDIILLCSDGLTKHVSDEEILFALESQKPSRLICQDLVDKACRKGGSDNITVVIAKCKDDIVGRVFKSNATGASYKVTKKIPKEPMSPEIIL